MISPWLKNLNGNKKAKKISNNLNFMKVSNQVSCKTYFHQKKMQEFPLTT